MEPPSGGSKECQGVPKKIRRASRANLNLEPPVKLPKSVPVTGQYIIWPPFMNSSKQFKIIYFTFISRIEYMNSSKPLKLQYLVILEAMAFIKQPEMELIYPP